MRTHRSMLAVVALAALATALLLFLLVRRQPAPAAPSARLALLTTSAREDVLCFPPSPAATGRTAAAVEPLPATNAAAVDPYAVIERLQTLLDTRDWPAALAEARRLRNHADPTVRREVLFALHWLGEAAIPDLVRMLVDPDPDIADQAAAFFGMAVEDCDGTGRRAAALALAADVASPRALDDVLQMLGGLPEQYAAPPVIKLLASGDPEVVAKAQQALWFLSGGETFTNAAQWSAWYRQLPPPEPDPVVTTTADPSAIIQALQARRDSAPVTRRRPRAP